MFWLCQVLLCCWQSIANPLQVVDALGRIGKAENPQDLVRPVIPCEQPFRYRNKMSFSLSAEQSCGGLSTGFGFKKASLDSLVGPSYGACPAKAGRCRSVAMALMDVCRKLS